ncbi:RNA polymerase sigma factor [Actinoplanes friuliensis]|uniref:RNA polymerase sigma factor n=1 Tax=Actinoplanes friuliensis DSM 7358 TaxID=1246995 RepID=U5VP44_9ACTN|nr:sigma-70 family RNA polymerase sigma factor [Actinoplanes friuliensis]AGZ38567.1 RNA polymerase sigma factor [Actinoplanes friuliensis DSM 7358]
MVEHAGTKFEDFYRAELRPLIWFAVRVGAARAETEDVAQEAMKAAWAGWARIENPRAYVRTAVLRVVRRTGYQVKRNQEAALRAAGPPGVGAESFEAEARRVLDLLRALPEAQREVMALTMDGYDPLAISQITGRKDSTVRSHLRHARRNLTRAIDEHHPEKEANDGS